MTIDQYLQWLGANQRRIQTLSSVTRYILTIGILVVVSR